MSETASVGVSDRFLIPTKISPLRLFDRALYVKRDDLVDTHLSGNKFRKLFTLLNTSSERHRRVVSYGGSQSNAMLALARLCQMKGWEFIYYTKTLSTQLRGNPQGNLRLALGMGMVLEEVDHGAWHQHVRGLHAPVLDTQTLLVPQGGADPQAEAGVARLAEEIREWRMRHGIGELGVVTPAGTGTTAYYLARNLGECPVYTVPAVGDENYLREQMRALGSFPANLTILQTRRRYRFATPHRELAEMYRRLEAGGIVFDRIYAPVAFKALEEHLPQLPEMLLYVHSGGVSGNDTMLARYRHKGVI